MRDLAKIFTFRNFRSPGLAFGQNRETVASRSPDSWQHIHDRSICHILLPETCYIIQMMSCFLYPDLLATHLPVNNSNIVLYKQNLVLA